MIETEGSMQTDDVVLKQIPAARVAELSAGLAGYEAADISPVLGPLYQEMWRRLTAAGLHVTGAPIAYYEDDPDGAAQLLPVRVHAAVEVAGSTAAGDDSDVHDLDVRDLPGLDPAATVVHHGPMDEAGRSMQVLARWIEENGYQPVGYAREVCLEFDPDDPTKWVHELQLAVRPR
jgi:effector-binding domain-containing protein